MASEVETCGEYPAVTPGAQPSEEMEVRVVSLDAERMRRRAGSKPPAFEWTETSLIRLAQELVRQACAKGRK